MRSKIVLKSCKIIFPVAVQKTPDKCGPNVHIRATHVITNAPQILCQDSHPSVSLCKTCAFNCANFPPGPETPSIFLCSTICLFQCDILLCDTHPLKNQRPNICTKQYLLTKKLHIVLAFRQHMIYAPLGTRKSKLYTTNKIKCNSFSTRRQKVF